VFLGEFFILQTDLPKKLSERNFTPQNIKTKNKKSTAYIKQTLPIMAQTVNKIAQTVINFKKLLIKYSQSFFSHNTAAAQEPSCIFSPHFSRTF
jgi:hypothetical protein